MNTPTFPGSLARADWPKREGLAALTAALGIENVRFVGGAVRDTLLGAEVHDVDCATPLLPDTVMDRCKQAGIRVVPTGIDHGTVTAVFDDGPVEITTLRHDVSTDGRRATVAFASEWREDAARRDFTINALYAHPESRTNASPRITCGSCAITGSRRVSARSWITKPKKPAPNLPTR